MQTGRSFLIALLTIVLASPGVLSADPVAPGTYRHWHGVIDEALVYRSFRADDYDEILVEPLDISKVVIPQRAGESREAVFSALPTLKTAFMDALQKNLRHRRAASGATGRKLLVRVHLIKADPGTRSPDFGDIQANAAKLAVRGEVIDLQSNTLLLAFRQQRWSGVVTIGKTSAQLLRDAAAFIGQDVAQLLSSF